MAVLIDQSMTDTGFEIQLNYIEEHDDYFLVVMASPCCGEEFQEWTDSSGFSYTSCPCKGFNFTKSPRPRFYISEEMTHTKFLEKWIQFWATGEKSKVEVNIEWQS